MVASSSQGAGASDSQSPGGSNQAVIFPWSPTEAPHGIWPGRCPGKPMAEEPHFGQGMIGVEFFTNQPDSLLTSKEDCAPSPGVLSRQIIPDVEI